MKRILATSLLLAGTLATAYSQKAHDVIENGLALSDREHLFLKFDGTSLMYHKGTAFDVLQLRPIPDSLILLPRSTTLNVYVLPLNPLNYGTRADIAEIEDLIETSAAGALSDITTMLAKVVAPAAPAPPGAAGVLPPPDPCTVWINNYNSLVSDVNRDRKAEGIAIFRRLKALSFESESVTITELDRINADLETLEAALTATRNAIRNLRNGLDQLMCGGGDAFERAADKYALIRGLNDMEDKWTAQNSYIADVRALYRNAKQAQEQASGMRWLKRLDPAPVRHGKITIYTFQVIAAGFQLNTKEEIEKTEAAMKASKVFRVRRFQTFIPELSAGVAYTNLSYPKYSTITDADGVQRVTQASNENISRLNVTVMLNYNLFITHSPLHPFWQIGIGANDKLPTLLTGLGIRVNAAGIRRLAIAGGIAMSWIQELNSLKVNDQVDGQGVIDADLSYKFSDRPKAYIGLQYNF